MDADRKKKKPTWTEERVARLRELWAEGLSASEIARELGGVTRNAVIGKVHRLRLERRAPSRRGTAAKNARPAPPSRRRPPAVSGTAALKPEPEAAQKAMPAPKPRRARLVFPPPPAEGRIKDIMKLTRHTCRWPIGDPGEEGFAYCGAQVSAGHPYCEHHARMAYQSSGDRRRTG